MKSSYAFRPVAGSGRVMLLACGLLAAGSSVGAPADHVIDNGQVVNLPGDRPDPWTTGGHLFVGFNDTGMLNVSDGAEVNAGFTVVGNFADAEGDVYVLDLHTTSGPSPAFGVLDDTLANRAFAMQFPVPLVLGLEEELEGTLLNYLTTFGVISMGFESGQHEAPEAVDGAEAAIWTALAARLVR